MGVKLALNMYYKVDTHPAAKTVCTSRERVENINSYYT